MAAGWALDEMIEMDGQPEFTCATTKCASGEIDARRLFFDNRFLKRVADFSYFNNPYRRAHTAFRVSLTDEVKYSILAKCGTKKILR